MLTGQFDARSVGRSVHMVLNRNRLVVRFPTFRDALSVRNRLSMYGLTCLKLIREQGFSVTLRIGSILSFRILPQANLLLRLLFPRLEATAPPAPQ